MMTDERLAELRHLIEYGQTCDHHWVDSDTGYLLDMAAESVAEIERLRAVNRATIEATRLANRALDILSRNGAARQSMSGHSVLLWDLASAVMTESSPEQAKDVCHE